MEIAVGTEKGAYRVNADTDAVEGPLFEGWKVTAFGSSPTGEHLAAVASNWFGTAIHRSSDWSNWEQIPDGPSYGESRELSQIWTLATENGRIYAGVAEAGLFVSDDAGATWSGVVGLNEHPTRSEWQPGLGGLCAHRILQANGSIWVAISAVGVFRSDDGGDTWTPKNDGIPSFNPEGPRPEIGYCVHNLDHDPANPQRMWRQDHAGVFRSENGGDTWERIENGLPAGFGFVMRRDHASGRLFVVPLHSDVNRVPPEGRFGSWMSPDDGDTWLPAGTGWDPNPTFTTVLRGAADADGKGRVALGTTSGAVWVTEDAGDSWRRIAATFPRIGAISIL